MDWIKIKTIGGDIVAVSLAHIVSYYYLKNKDITIIQIDGQTNEDVSNFIIQGDITGEITKLIRSTKSNVFQIGE